MTDLYLALALMAAVSVALFLLGLALGRRLARGALAVAALLTCAFIVGFVRFASDRLLLARLLPFSNVVVLADWLPAAVALLAGLAWRRIDGRAWRKGLLVVPLVLLCGFRSANTLFGTAPPPDDRWKRGVCLQTSQASCSAAAAATLLKAHGIDTNEAEMARLCLTRPAGTPMHGLYRGLKLKTKDSPWDVGAFRGDLNSLRGEKGPVILSVRLDPGPGVDERYARL